MAPIRRHKGFRFCAMAPNFMPSRPMDLATPGIFRHGASIKLRGALTDGDVKNFTLQLATPEGIALYMMVPSHGEITLNSFKLEGQAGRWEREERHFNPIKAGHRFRMKIKHQHDFMVIKVNGHLICRFYHRDMPNKIRTVGIRGDIHVEDVHFKGFKHQQREGPAVIIHSNLPPPPQVVQQIVVPQSQQIVVQSAPQTIVQQTVYPQVAPTYIQQVTQQVTQQPQPGPIGSAAVAAVMVDNPPPYPAEEFPSIPTKV